MFAMAAPLPFEAAEATPVPNSPEGSVSEAAPKPADEVTPTPKPKARRGRSAKAKAERRGNRH